MGKYDDMENDARFDSDVQQTSEQPVYIDAVIKLTQTDEGRVFLKRLFEDCGLFSNTFQTSSASFYHEGRRSVALNIFNIIKDKDALLLMPIISERIKSVKSN